MNSEAPKRFSDFAEEEGPLEGDKAKLDSILNHEIMVIGHRIQGSKYQGKNNSGKCLTVQFRNPEDQEKRVFFTGSDVLIEQMEKYGHQVPFLTTIKKVDRYYTFS